MKNKPLKPTHTIVLTIAVLLTVFSIIGSVAAAGLIPLVDDIDSLFKNSLVKKESVNAGQQDESSNKDQYDATSDRDAFRKIEFNSNGFQSVVKPKLGNCYNCGVVTAIESIPKNAENIDALSNEEGLLNYLEAHQENARIIALDDAKHNRSEILNPSEHQSMTYLIKVQMQDGTKHAISQDTPPEYEVGDKVRLSVGKMITA